MKVSFPGATTTTRKDDKLSGFHISLNCFCVGGKAHEVKDGTVISVIIARRNNVASLQNAIVGAGGTFLENVEPTSLTLWMVHKNKYPKRWAGVRAGSNLKTIAYVMPPCQHLATYFGTRKRKKPTGKVDIIVDLSNAVSVTSQVTIRAAALPVTRTQSQETNSILAPNQIVLNCILRASRSFEDTTAVTVNKEDGIYGILRAIISSSSPLLLNMDPRTFTLFKITKKQYKNAISLCDLSLLKTHTHPMLLRESISSYYSVTMAKGWMERTHIFVDWLDSPLQPPTSEGPRSPDKSRQVTPDEDISFYCILRGDQMVGTFSVIVNKEDTIAGLHELVVQTGGIPILEGIDPQSLILRLFVKSDYRPTYSLSLSDPHIQRIYPQLQPSRSIFSYFVDVPPREVAARYLFLVDWPGWPNSPPKLNSSANRAPTPSKAVDVMHDDLSLGEDGSPGQTDDDPYSDPSSPPSVLSSLSSIAEVVSGPQPVPHPDSVVFSPGQSVNDDSSEDTISTPHRAPAESSNASRRVPLSLIHPFDDSIPTPDSAVFTPGDSAGELSSCEDAIPAAHDASVRPLNASRRISLPLIHPIFGHLVDDLQKYSPTTREYGFMDAFFDGISRIPSSSGSDEHAFTHSLQVDLFTRLVQEKLGISFKFDVELRSMCAEVNDRVYMMLHYPGAEGFSLDDDPFVSASDAYERYVCRLSDDTSELPALPCLHVIPYGPYLSFAGSAILAGNHQFEVLLPAILLPCNTTYRDDTLRAHSARAIGALANATERLKIFYAESPFRVLRAPYPTYYRRLNNKLLVTLSLDELVDDNGLNYAGREDGSMAIRVCFVRNGSEAYGGPLSFGHGLGLRAVERLPGGWVMLVSDAAVAC